jgi:2-methylfumaryl-CoA hydratase
VRAWSEVLDKAETAAPGVGAIRLRLVATKDGAEAGALKGEDGKYLPEVLLDLDYWALMPDPSPVTRLRNRLCIDATTNVQRST